MQNFGQNLQGFDKPRPWPVKQSLAVAHEHRVGPRRLQPIKPESGPALAQLTLSTIERKPARDDKNRLGIGPMQICNGQPRRVLPGSAEQQLSSGQESELRHPVAAAHRWVKPLKASDLTLGGMGRATGHALHPLTDGFAERRSRMLGLDRFRYAADIL